MKVFISWSGVRSHALAEALHAWVPLVLHYVEPWLSQADIAAGQRWADQVAKELEASNFGIVCVTRDNVSSPWVLFETGALAKSMQDSRVIPVLLDLEIRDITGPLAQFQAKKVDRAGFAEVVQSLNQLSQHPVPDDRVKLLFEALWPELEKKIAEIPTATSPAKHARPQPEILEELVASVRSLDSRIRDSEHSPRGPRPRRMRLHPMILHELSHMLAEKKGDPVSLLVLASALRDDIPWLYELGMEAYRAGKAGSVEEAAVARRRFVKAADLLREGPFPLEEIGFDPRMLHMIVRELEHVTEPKRVASEEASTKKPKRNRGEKTE